MGGKNKKKKSKTSGNGAAAAIAGAVSEAPDAAMAPLLPSLEQYRKHLTLPQKKKDLGRCLPFGSLLRRCRRKCR